MRRIIAALGSLSLALLSVGLRAQTIATINSASPTSVPSGSGDTVLTLTLRQSGTTKYNVCFYSGATSTPITPSAYNFQNASAVTYTLTVPGARFQTGGGSYTNSVYLASTGSTSCTAASQGISNIFSYSTTAVSYSVNSASPSSTPIGSGATSITFTGTFPTLPSTGTGLGLCFYNGTSNSPLLPTSQSGTTSATFSVPVADFYTAGTAKIYLASDTSTCTGVNPGYSTTLSYTVTQSITSSSPSPIPAGNGTTQVTLYGTFSGTSANVCFYTGTSSSATLLTPTAFTSYEVIFTVPAASLSIPPASFSSGTYNAKVYFGAAGATCNGVSPNISNTFSVPISYPQITSTSVATIPQINPAIAAYTPLPSRLDLIGSNFASGVYGTFTPNVGSAVTEGASAVIDGTNAPVTIPALSSTATSTSVNVCNNNGTYQYCASTPITLTNYPLTATNTSVSSSIANPNVNQVTNLNAIVTPGASSTTAGGTFIPGVPSGPVAFYDGSTLLGTGTLGRVNLSFAPASTQTIHINAGTDAYPEASKGQVRANVTPTPDVNSQFSSLVADFNADDIPDTLVIQSSTGVFHLFLGGSPLGTIQAEQTIYPSEYYCSSLTGVTVADFNGDGYPDIAYLCGDSGGESSIQVMLNQGDGSFSSNTTYLGEVIGNQLAAADVNKDGKIDLVLTGNTGTFCCTGQTFGIQTYLGDGSGNFSTGPLTTTSDVPGTQVVLKDVNNDGIPDLTFLHYNSTTSATEVTVWQGDGTGKFTQVATLPVCNCTVTKTKLYVTPFTASSAYPDIFVDYQEGSEVLAFTNKKTSSIAFNTIAPATYSNLTDVALGDFNTDGLIDFAFYNGTNITIQFGNGAGAFATAAYFAPYAPGSGTANALSLAAAPDLNNDGYSDLIAINPTATTSPNSSTITSFVTTGISGVNFPASFATSGSHTINTVYNGNVNVLGSKGSLPITVGQVTPTINWSPPSTTTTTTPVSTLETATAVDPSTGASVPGSFAYTYTPANGTYLSAGTQTITATFTPTNTSTYNSASSSHSITVNKVTPTISTTISPGNHTYQPNLATNYTATITGSNILPTGTVQFNNAGSPLGSAAGLTQAGTATVTSNITFASLPANSYTFTAAYSGDSVYNAITSSTTSYTVSKATPTFSYTPAPASITYGTALVAGQLNATAVDPNTGTAVSGNFTYSTAGFSSLSTGSVLPAGSNAITAAFASSDSNYNSGSASSTIAVAKASTATNISASPNTISPGQSVLLSITVTPNPNNSAVTGLVTLSDDNGTIPNSQVTLSNGSATLNYTPSNVGTHHISAAYAGIVNYTPSSSTAPATFIVTQKVPTITYTPSPSSITYGTALVASQFNATAIDPSTGASVPGTFTYTTPTGTIQTGSILPAGSNTITATFTPTDTNTYTTSAQTAVITVTQAAPNITYTANPASIPYGTALAASLFNATASVPGTFSYNPTLGTVLPVGTKSVTLTFTPTDTTDYSTVTKTAQVTVTQAAPVITWNPGTTTNTTTPISSLQTATASVPGAFTYSYNPAVSGSYLGVGTQSITANFTPTDTTDYTTASATRTLTVTKTVPTITTTINPASHTFQPNLATVYTPTITGANILPTGTVQFLNNGSNLSTPVGVTQSGPAQVQSPLTFASLPANTYNFSATYLGDAVYSAVTSTVTNYVVSKSAPAVTYTPSPASIAYGVALIANQLNATAADSNTGTILQGAFTYSTPTLTNLQPGTVLPAGNNVVTATFSPNDTTDYNTGTSTSTIAVSAASTTTTVSASPNAISPGQSVLLSATVTPNPNSTSITGQVTFADDNGTVPSSTVTLSNGSATLTYTPSTVGTHHISAVYAATSNYAASSSSTPAAFTVSQKIPHIAYSPTPSSISYGTGLVASQLTATATDPVTSANILGAFTYATSAGPVQAGSILPAGSNTITATFTPTDTTTYTTAAQTAVITVAQATPTVTYNANPASITYGTPLAANLFNATASVPGVFSYNPALGTVLPVGTKSVTLTFTPTDTTDYATIVKTATVTVTQVTPTITYTFNPPSITYGTPLAASLFNATASVPGTFSYNPAIGTVLPTGVNPVSILFTPTDTTDYATVIKSAQVTVTQATPTVTFIPNPATIFQGQPLTASQLDATSSVPGAFTYNPTLGTVLPAGANTITAVFTPTDTTDYASVTRTAVVTVNSKLTPVLTYTPTPTSIVYGTGLAATQLTASAVDPSSGSTIPGVFTFATAILTNLQAGAILPVGSNAVTATFTPTDTATYNTATKSASITVTQATPALTFTPNPASIPYGTKLSAAQLDAVQTTSYPGVITYSQAIGTILTAGQTGITATFTPTDTTDVATVTKTATVTVTQAVPTITWNPPVATTTNTPLDFTILNATASIPGTFAYTPSAGSYLSAGTQTLNLLFTPTDNADYQTASASRTISVSKAASTPIVLTANPTSQTAPNIPTVFTASIPGTNLTPTGVVQLFEGSNLLGSGNVTQTTGQNGAAAITVSLASGTHNIFAIFAGDGVYNGATSNTLTYLVGGATVPITFTPNPATIPYGTPLSASQLDATTTVPGTFAYSPALNTILNAGVNTITATFTPTDTATYATTTKTASVTVTQFTPVIVWNFSNIVLYGTTLSSAQLDAVANDINDTAVPGTYTYNPAAGTILPNGASLLTLNFTPTNTQNFTPAVATRGITVISPTTATTLNINPASITLGQSTTLTASVTDTAGATPVSGQVTFLDNRDTIGMVTLANGVATLTYTPTTIGTHPIVAIFSGTNFYGSSATGTLAVGQGLPVITFTPNPATISYGTPLSTAQLDATVTNSVPGTFTYSSPLNTVLPVGANTITATFTPTDTLDYATTTATAVVNVISTGTATTLTVTANGGPVATVTSGAVITLTAAVTSTSDTSTLGQVNFCEASVASCTGTNILGSAQITSAGTAIYRFIPGIGVHSYKAVFLGTKANVTSTSAASPLLVTGTFPTTTTFTATGATGNFTLTAVVTGTGSPTASPTGAISFLDTSNANAPLATATLGSPTLAESFFAVTPATIAGIPYRLATGDFNGDGIVDIVADADRSSGTLTILLGNGDGTFTQKQTITAGTQPYGVVVGDFNHDGILDLASIDLQTSYVYIQLGNGDGTFTPGATIALPSTALTLTTADFNQDGVLDLAVSLGSQVAILLGSGDGNFTLLPSPAAVPGLSYSLTTADFNGDGYLDVAASNTGDKSVSVLFGKGDGTFSGIATTPLDASAISLAPAADFDGNGIPDLAVTDYDTSDKIVILLGKGDGTFSVNPIASSHGNVGDSLAIADFNHDGILDIAGPGFSSTGYIYLGVGDGTFTQGPSLPANQYQGVAAADFNGDGLPDIATGVYPGSVAISLNTFISTATATAANVAPTGSGAHLVTANYPGDTTFASSASSAINLTGATLTPTLTWTPAPLILGTPLGSAQLNAIATGVNGSILPGTFAYTPAAGAILPIGRQTLSVTFTPTDLVDYTVATLTAAVQVNPISTVTLLTSTPNPAAYGQTVTLTATTTPASSFTTPITGLVTFFDGQSALGSAQATNGIASLTISTLSVGTHTLSATYAGDTTGDYLTSTSATISQSISTAIPIITWTPNPATIPYGTKLTAAQLNAVARNASGAILSGTFTYNPAVGTILSAGTQTLSVTFTPDDSVHYATTTATSALTVTRATPAISWSTPAPINQGTALSSTQLNATAIGVDGLALPGTFTYNPAAGTILSAGTQTLTLTFTPSDATDYVTTTASVAISVLNPSTVTTLTTSLTPAQFGQPVTLTATIAPSARTTSPLAGNVTFFDGPTQLGTPVAITLTPAGATATLIVATLGTGEHQLTALYANDPSYLTSTSLPLTQTITIAPTTLVWTPIVPTIPYGTPLSAAQLNAVPASRYVPNVTGTLIYTPAAGTILSAGSQTLTATFTPTDATDFLPSAGSAVINVTQATPTLTWQTPAAIVQGTALSAAQLNAAATGINAAALPGTYTYTPAAGTVLQAGTTTLRVLFTPTDTVDYTTATASVPLTVTAPGTTTTLTSSLNPSQSGQSVTFNAAVVQTGTSTQPLTGTVTFSDGTLTLATVPLTNAAASYTTAALSVATHTIRAVFNGTSDYIGSNSNQLTQSVTSATTSIACTPTPAGIVYGTPLTASQLNASATSATATSVPGAFAYTLPNGSAVSVGTILPAGAQTLTVTFTPSDTVNFTAASATATITVSRATPTLTWATPAATAVGTPLSSTQLNASATGINAATLPGTYAYTPAAGTLVTAGAQTLSVLFTPTDTANYTTASASVTLNGTAVTLTSLSSNTANLGDPDKTITLTGTGFVSNSVARSNGSLLATTYINATTLTAVIPGSNFQSVQTLQITVNDPTQNQTTSALPFTVQAPTANVKVTGPTTANPGDQPTIQSALATAYPVNIVAAYTLTFIPGASGVVDPAVQFATGGTTYSTTIPAGSTAIPTLQIQSGTVAGTIQITLVLTAAGANVTPAGLAPLTINVPTVVPGVTGISVTRTGRTLTVLSLGYSNTREVTQAHFHFTPAAGQQIDTQDVTIDVSAIFAGWYSQTASTAYGSTFLYTQVFTLDDDASVVGQVTVTLSNGIGVSASGSSQ